MKIIKNKKADRRKRHDRVRRKVKGTAARPRMSLMVSNRNIYVQLIDDDSQKTLAAVSTIGDDATKVNVATARTVGRQVAEAAKAKGIEAAVVDRGGFKYHGRIKAIVDGAIECGLRISDKAPAAADESKEEKA